MWGEKGGGGGQAYQIGRWHKLLCSRLTDIVCIMLLTVTNGGSRAPQEPPAWLRPWMAMDEANEWEKAMGVPNVGSTLWTVLG